MSQSLSKEVLLNGKAQYIWPPRWGSLFCKSVNYIFNIKRSWSKLVNTRRSTVPSIPLQKDFNGLRLIQRSSQGNGPHNIWQNDTHQNDTHQNDTYQNVIQRCWMFCFNSCCALLQFINCFCKSFVQLSISPMPWHLIGRKLKKLN